MASTVKTNALKINVMPEDVHSHFINNGLIQENQLYLVEDNTMVLTDTGTVVSQHADFAEVAEWSDGNPTGEDRIGYFVSISSCASGISMSKATSTSDIRGVTMARPGFAANASIDKYDSNGNLLSKFNYVGFAGFVPVIDNGTCEVQGRCMSSDDGTAVPSPNNMGYQVIDRIDSTHILILVEPQADMLVRVRSDITNIENILMNIDYDKLLAFDVNEIVIGKDTTGDDSENEPGDNTGETPSEDATSSKLGTGKLGYMILG